MYHSSGHVAQMRGIYMHNINISRNKKYFFINIFWFNNNKVD